MDLFLLATSFEASLVSWYGIAVYLLLNTLFFYWRFHLLIKDALYFATMLSVLTWFVCIYLVPVGSFLCGIFLTDEFSFATATPQGFLIPIIIIACNEVVFKTGLESMALRQSERLRGKMQWSDFSIFLGTKAVAAGLIAGVMMIFGGDLGAI